jgi:hypothetical protein
MHAKVFLVGNLKGKKPLYSPVDGAATILK